MGEIGVNTFAKGLQTDASVINQPEGTYIDALNITLLNDSGEYHSLCNEKGTTEPLSIPAGYIVIGHTVVDENIVIFLKNPTSGFSQIGIINDNTYTQKVPIAGEDNELAFDLAFPVDVKGKKLFNGDISVYFTDDNNPMRAINLDDPPDDIAKMSKITPDFDLPIIDYSEVITGGNLTGGVYQFVARYLDKELVPTTTSIPTQPIPIVASREADNTDITKVFGAAYDEVVNKSIELDLSNLDTDYPYFELIAITYTGATSAPEAYVVNSYDITATTKTVIFSGIPEDATAVTIAELQSIPITYSNAKAVEQKDSKLFFANLTETKSKYKDELQEIANNISTTYGTTTENESFYADPLNCASSKTYKRGETYSFGLAVIFKDGTQSFTYHIPGNDKVSGVNVPATGGTMGTYVSAEEYPLGQGYPVGNVRHHIMPTLAEEIHFSGTAQIKPLYVNFTMAFGFQPSAALKAEIQGFVFLRERRDTPEKRSKLAQGFVTNIYMGGSTYESDTDNELDSDVVRRGDVIDSSFHFKKNVGFFNSKLNTYYDMEDYASGGTCKTQYQHTLKASGTKFSTHQGFYYSVKSLDETIYDDRDSTPTPFDGLDINRALEYHQLDWRMESDNFCFFSPETLLSDGVFVNPEETIGANLVKEFALSSSFSPTTYKIDANYDRTNFKEYIRDEASINLLYTINGTTFDYGAQAKPIKNAQYINNGEQAKLPGLNTFEFDNNYGGKFLYLKTIGTHIQHSDTTGNVIDIDFARDPKTPYGNITIFEDVGEVLVDGGTFDSLDAGIDLYEIANPLVNQYGDITSSVYVPIEVSLDVNQTSFTVIRNGDIFITEYTAVNKDVHNRYFNFLNTVSWNSKFFQEDFKDNDDKRMYSKARVHENLYSPQTIPGAAYGAAVTYFVESKINCYFRFTGENGIPYFPNVGIDAHWNTLPQLGENKNYNVQYSIENNIKSYFTRPAFDETIATYPNRVIYSETANEDDKVDYYKIFKQSSFYDLPEETGEIWDMFVWNNELFLHTPKALWRSYVNSVTREANSIGEVVLGTGGLFGLKSQKVLTSDGGYGGTISQFGNAITPFGYFFVDLLQRKVFKLTDSLEEISLQGMQQFFDNILVVPNLLGTVVDNTFNNPALGITMGWDNEYRRLLLTQRSGTANNFTISYSPVNQSWVSLHSYTPNTYITYDKFLYSIVLSSNTDSEIFLHNTGDYGAYYNNPPEISKVTLVSNANPAHEKAFDNFLIHARSYSNGSFENLDMFNTIRCVNDYQDSGTLDILTDNSFNPTVANNQVLCRWKKSHFQVAIPRDNQEANLDTPGDWKQASRLKSKYLETTLEYDNLNNREFIVNFIQYLYRIVAR